MNKIYTQPQTFSNTIWSNVIDTEPTSEPIANSVMKNFLKVSNSSDDDLIASIITTARQIVEIESRRIFLQTTFTLNLDRFPTNTNWIILPVSPLSSVTHIKYYNEDNSLTTWDSSNYIVDDKSMPPRIRLSEGGSFPSTYTRPNAVEVKYVAGYASSSSAGYPTGLVAAIYLVAGHLYQNRQSVVDKMHYNLPQGVKSIINNYKNLEV